MMILCGFGAGCMAGYLESAGLLRMRWFRTTLAGVFLLIGCLAFLDQVHQFTDEITWDKITLVAFKTSIGDMWLVRQGIGVLVLLLAFLPAGRILLCLYCIAIAAALSPVGHPMAAPSVTFVVTTHFVHLTCFAFWFGGLAVLAADTDTRTDPLRLARFSTLALWTVAGLTATGVLLSWQFIPTPSAFLNSFYGRILSVKIVFFLIVLGVARQNKHLVQQALASDSTVLKDGRLLRRVRFELAGLFVITVLAVLLAYQTPPMDG